MDIVILSHFCMDFSESDNDRFLYIAKKLSPTHDVEIITSDFFHTAKRHRRELLHPQPCKVTFLPEPGYPKNVCLKRFYSHYVWGLEVKKYLKTRKRPDVIYSAVPSLTAARAAAKYCRENGIRFLVDIQDLWPEAFEMVLHIPCISAMIFYPIRLIADSIYKSADGLAAVSGTYLKRGLEVSRNCKCSETVFLGTRLSDFDSNCKKPPVLEKKAGELWLGYCGTLGKSYDIDCVTDAIAMLEKDVKRPRFIVMGDGDKQDDFKRHAAAMGVDAFFAGRVPYDRMCSTLSKCDIVVNPITRGSAGSIINKHADYAASGLPVLNTQESEEYRALVEKYRMGLNCKNGDPADLCQKLTRLIGDPELRREMGKNARRCAEACFDRETTYRKLTDMIEGISRGEK